VIKTDYSLNNTGIFEVDILKNSLYTGFGTLDKVLFLRRYFFFVLVALLLLGLFNGLILLPVLLVILGPPPSLLPRGEDPSSLPPPTPPPPPPAKKITQPRGSSRQKPGASSASVSQPHTGRLSGKLARRHHNSDLSLSTIAEESHTHSSSSQSSCSSYDEQQQLPGSLQSSLTGGSTSVFLEPHITVETSTLPHSVCLLFLRTLSLPCLLPV
jgi:hypothetical protein